MSDLPKGWALTTVKELAGSTGLFVDGDWVESKDQDPNGDIRLLQLADIGDGSFLDKSNRWINEGAFAQLRCTELATGDILIARMPDPLGRACLMPALEQRCVTVVDVAALRVDPRVANNRWVMHTINAPQLRAEIGAQASGTTRKRISRGNLGGLQIPLPPESEQKRIADKLDTVLTRVDAVNARLARVAPILKRFRQSVLVAATSGRLTKDWRSNRKRLSETEDVPPLWQAATIASAAINQDNLRNPISEIERRERKGAFNYYGASGVIDTIDGFTHDGEFLLIGEDGANLLTRSKPIAFRASGRIWVNNHAHVLTHHSMARLSYLSFAINAINLRPWVTGSAQPKLTRKALDSIPVHLPPEDEQSEIVR